MSFAFFSGVFNGDPHPGNILLMPDGRLGLIDFGQVREITNSERWVKRKKERKKERRGKKVSKSN